MITSQNNILNQLILGTLKRFKVDFLNWEKHDIFFLYLLKFYKNIRFNKRIDIKHDNGRDSSTALSISIDCTFLHRPSILSFLELSRFTCRRYYDDLFQIISKFFEQISSQCPE